MVLARWQATIVDDNGDVQVGASIEVRRESSGAPLVSLYSDRSGVTPIGNPMTADSDGYAAFHVAGGAYKITATKGAFSRTWRYVPIGLAQESDSLMTSVAWFFSSSTTDADPGAGYFKFNHATLGSVTQIFFDNESAFGETVSALLDSFDDGGASAHRGIITLQSVNGSGLFVAAVTGSVTDGTGYRKVSVTPISTSGAFSADAVVNVTFARTGATGAQGDQGVQGPTGATGATGATGDVAGSRQIISGAGLTGGGDLTADRTLAVGAGTGIVVNADDVDVDKASDANVRAAASNKVLTSDLLESAAAEVALSDASPVAVDWDSGVNFSVTISANRSIGNPTNGQPGTFRTIYVIGNDATDRTVTFGNQFLGEVPTITDCDSGRAYLLSIYCKSSSHFVVSSKKALGT